MSLCRPYGTLGNLKDKEIRLFAPFVTVGLSTVAFKSFKLGISYIIANLYGGAGSEIPARNSYILSSFVSNVVFRNQSVLGKQSDQLSSIREVVPQMVYVIFHCIGFVKEPSMQF
jgi:hypothetical protein